MSWSAVLGKPEVFAYLAPISRDIRPMVWSGLKDRVRQVLSEDPSQVSVVLEGEEGPTALYCLPDDEAAAAEMAELLLRHGADPGFRNPSGVTPAEYAGRRGLDEAAELIAGWPTG